VHKRDSNTVAGGSRSARSFDEICSLLGARLHARAPELEAGLANLVEGTADARELSDPGYLDYLDSLRATRTTVLAYAVEVIRSGERHAAEIPAAVLTSARLAARCDVALDAVLRRYSAGNTLCADVLLEEAERAHVSSSDLRRLLHRQATLSDRLLEAVSEEYAREAQSRPTTTAEWRREHIRALLSGRQPSGELELDYDLGGNHLALMARGVSALEAVRALAQKLDRRLLADRLVEEPVWACWLGGRSSLAPEQVLRTLDDSPALPIVLGLGERGEGITGWRLSYRQAKAALSIAERQGRSILRYADVAVLASVLRDDLGSVSLRRLYLEPLESARDGGKVARETLRAYFATQRNVSSTAAVLGVDRRTVTNRLRAVEDLFGRPLQDFATDLETALQLAD
jgi:PucR C-terminal helix-turn-helix domain/GGDEF-like domain